MKQKFYFLLVVTMITITTCVGQISYPSYSIDVNGKEVKIELLELNKKNISFEDVINEMNKNNLRPATNTELELLSKSYMNFAGTFINQNNELAIIALDTSLFNKAITSYKMYHFPFISISKSPSRLIYDTDNFVRLLSFEIGHYDDKHPKESPYNTFNNCVFAVIKK